MTSSLQTLTKFKNSKLSHFFEEKGDLLFNDDNRVVLSRDPVIFKHLLDYLNSEQKFVPSEINSDIKTRIGLELSYWKLPVHHEYKILLSKNYAKLQELFNSEPVMFPEASTKALETWKTLEPITVEEILEKSNIDIDLESDEFEYKRKNFDNGFAEGIFKKGSDSYGIVRAVTKYGEIYEGFIQDGKLNSYSRAFFANGNYYIGMYKNNLREGQGKFVSANG